MPLLGRGRGREDQRIVRLLASARRKTRSTHSREQVILGSGQRQSSECLEVVKFMSCRQHAKQVAPLIDPNR